MNRDAERSAWREPMTWLVVGLPLAVVMAAVATLAVARRSPSDASHGDTRRIAQIQIDDLAPDREAARRGVHAQLQADPASGAIVLRLDGAEPAPADGLQLAMLHPLDERLDRRLSLHHEAAGWKATTPPWRTAQAWELRLQSPRGEWRLAGRLAADSTHATLSPAVER